jgi:hypothetical protein
MFLLAFVKTFSTSHSITKMSTAPAAPSSDLPPPGVLLRAAKLAIDDDRPIMLDYWADSRAKKCVIGVKDAVKYLVKSDTEYTSTIENLYKAEGCFIILTENSIYIVSQDIPVRKIVSNTAPATQ